MQHHMTNQTITAGWGFRVQLLLMTLLCVDLLGYALFAEKIQGFLPCLLCMAQRWVFVLIALSCPHWVFVSQFRIARWLGAVWISGLAGVGAAIAGRHVWLQTHPGQGLQSCYETLQAVFQDLPLARAFDGIWAGSPSCEKIDWTLFGLTMSQWTLGVFIGLIVWVWVALWLSEKRHRMAS